MSRSQQLWFYGALFCYCLITLLLYWPALQGELVWDDRYIAYNYNLFNMDHWFYNSFQRSFLDDAYYRPLPLLTLMWNGLLGFRYFPILAHATNIALFCLNVFLVMRLTYKIAAKPCIAALLAGGLYTANPAMMESTAWISGRCDLLLTFFILSALCLDVDLKNRFALKVALVSLSFFCAALSKEMAVVFPLILLLWHLYEKNIHLTNKQQLRTWIIGEKNYIYYAAILFTGLCYLLLRYSLLGHLLGSPDSEIDAQGSANWLGYFLLIMKTYTWYFLLLILPYYNLSAIYVTEIPVQLNDWSALMGCVIFALTIYLFFSRAVNVKTKYGLAVIALLFLPISNIARLNIWDNFIHLRFLTLPFSCLIVFFVPILVDWLAIQQKRIQVVITAVCVLWFMAGIANLKVTVPLWSNELSLWKWATQTTPHAQIVWGNYTSALYKSSDYAGCIRAVEESEKIQGYNPRVYVNASFCYNAIGNKNQARAYIMKVLQTPGLPMDINSITYMQAASLNIDKALADGINTNNTDSLEYKNIVTLLGAAIYADHTNFEARYLLITWHVLINDRQALDVLIGDIFHQKPEIQKTQIENIKKYISSKNMLNNEQRLYLDSALTNNHNTEIESTR